MIGLSPPLGSDRAGGGSCAICASRPPPRFAIERCPNSAPPSRGTVARLKDLQHVQDHGRHAAARQLGIGFELHPYAYDPDAARVGLQAAEALGVDPAQTFKTLMAEVDGKPVCVVVPSDSEVWMKKLAACFGGKSARDDEGARCRADHRLQGRRHRPVRAEKARCRRRSTKPSNCSTASNQCRPARAAAEPRAGRRRAGDRGKVADLTA